MAAYKPLQLNCQYCVHCAAHASVSNGLAVSQSLPPSLWGPVTGAVEASLATVLRCLALLNLWPWSHLLVAVYKPLQLNCQYCVQCTLRCVSFERSGCAPATGAQSQSKLHLPRFFAAWPLNL